MSAAATTATPRRRRTAPCWAWIGRSTPPRAATALRRFIRATTRARLSQSARAAWAQCEDRDYLLAVNGAELRAPTDPDALLQLADADTTVDLTIADSPVGAPRHIVVTPVAKELSLRESAWIAHNRAVVDKLSGGRVGYVYMSDMEQLGLQQFVRQFYAQLGKQALIMDDRWNGGGFIAPFALERLRRMLVTLGTNRESGISTEPQEVLNGPKVALLNHWSASDGDIFPYLFHLYGLGKLVGTRSWGGVRGIRGFWQMMDGGYVTIPEDALYTLDSQWARREPWSRSGHRDREPARGFARRPRCAAGGGGRLDAQGHRRQTGRPAATPAGASAVPAGRNCGATALA
jgi:hypothetical protein